MPQSILTEGNAAFDASDGIFAPALGVAENAAERILGVRGIGGCLMDECRLGSLDECRLMIVRTIHCNVYYIEFQYCICINDIN